MRQYTVVSGLALVLLGSASLADDVRVEEALRTRWADAYNRGDIDALSAMYAADARLQQGYCPVVTGRDAIKAFWLVDLGGGTATTHLQVEDAFHADDLVYVSGTYAVEFSDSETEAGEAGGTYLQIWRRQGAQDWLIFRETWTNLACAKIHVEPGSEGEDGAGAAQVDAAA